MEVKIYNYQYSSLFAPHIENFIRLKRNAGFPYNSSARILRVFDEMIMDKFPDSRYFTKEIVDAWISLKPNEHPNGLLRRMTPIRGLSQYMYKTGIGDYIIPGHIPDHQIKYEAHIYTKDELISFFREADNIPYSSFSPYKCYIIPVIFRLYFLCGLRLSEGIHIKREDINFNTGCITISESKSWKLRKIYVSQELLAMLREYDEIIDNKMPDRRCFFPTFNGDSFIAKCTIGNWFHEIEKIAFKDIPLVGNKRTTHCFRHTFATERINRWIEDEEVNINVMYPYLSQYMGHCHFEDTDYYLKLVASFYPEINKRMAEVNSNVLPEVDEYEE